MDEAFETMDPRGELHHQMLTALVDIDTACGSSDVGELPARSPPAGGIDAAVSAVRQDRRCCQRRTGDGSRSCFPVAQRSRLACCSLRAWSSTGYSSPRWPQL